jgi:hypothetical protein
MQEKIDLKKYAYELSAAQNLPPASVEIPALAAIALISHVQLAVRHPEVTEYSLKKAAIDAARQLQALFNQDSEIHKVLELGWNPDKSIYVPEGIDDWFIEDFAPEAILDRYSKKDG